MGQIDYMPWMRGRELRRTPRLLAWMMVMVVPLTDTSRRVGLTIMDSFGLVDSERSMDMEEEMFSRELKMGFELGRELRVRCIDPGGVYWLLDDG